MLVQGGQSNPRPRRFKDCSGQWSETAEAAKTNYNWEPGTGLERVTQVDAMAAWITRLRSIGAGCVIWRQSNPGLM